LNLFNKGKKYNKILCIPDPHAPFVAIDALNVVGKWAKNHKPDLVVILGDLMDQKAWSRWPKDPDDYSPHEEFERAVNQVELIHDLFPKSQVLIGNHDIRVMHKAMEVGLTKHMVRELDEVFPYEGWDWRLNPAEKLIVNTERGPIWFCHGDEQGGTVAQKSRLLGLSVVQGHTHQAGITFSKGLAHNVFGMECGMLLDKDSKAARYAAASGKYPVTGFGVIKYGVPYFIPVTGKERKI
jgi:predicted phosphodiesterase